MEKCMMQIFLKKMHDADILKKNAWCRYFLKKCMMQISKKMHDADI